MTLDEVVAEIIERGLELELAGPLAGKWEAKVRLMHDEDHISSLGFARDTDPAFAVDRALYACLSENATKERFVPDLSTIAPPEPKVDLRRVLGLNKPLGITRRI